VTEVLASSGCGEPSDFASVVCNDLVFAPAPLTSGENSAAAAASASDAIASAGEPLSTGEVDDRSVSGAWGKVLVQRDIVATASTGRVSSSTSSSSSRQPSCGISIFVGDSLTDLAALIEAEVGVLMVKSSKAPMSSSLQQACTFFGVEIVALRDYLAVVEPPSTTGENGDATAAGAMPAVIEGTEKPLRIYSTDNWLEVVEMLSALEPHPQESLS